MIGGDLITYRPDIQVLDATIRDGGLVNDFYFTDEFIRALYEANIKAGVDYMEFGYKASKEMFDVNKFGKWKFSLIFLSLFTAKLFSSLILFTTPLSSSLYPIDISPQFSQFKLTSL